MVCLCPLALQKDGPSEAPECCQSPSEHYRKTVAYKRNGLTGKRKVINNVESAKCKVLIGKKTKVRAGLCNVQV